MSTESSEIDAEPRADRRAWIGLGVLAAGLSMIVIDGTIVGVALPVIITDLNLDLTDAQWVNSVYSVVFAALLLTAGRLGDRLGRRRMFILGVLVFLTGSLFAAMATSATSLIVARVVQGVGGAFVLPTTLSSVNATFRGKDRIVAFAVWGAVISGMAAVGPLLGGWLTTYFSWPWIFLVNIPIGLAVVVGALFAVRETKATITEPGLDVDGLLLSVIGFGGVIFALIEGQSLGWWKPIAEFSVFGFDWPADAPVSVVPVVGAIGLVCLVLFVVWERHRARGSHRSALLDLSLFSVPTFTWGNLTALAVAIGEFGLLLVLPLFLVNALGLSTMGAGLVLAAMALGAFGSGAAARHIAGAIGAPRTVILGLALEAVGVVVVALFISSTVSPWLLAVLLAVYGAGLGLASAQLTGTVLADIPTEKSGQGSATQSTVRQLGAALGSAILGAVLSVALAHNLTDRLEPVTAVPPPVQEQLVTATRDSAGGTISGLREQGDEGKLGPAGPEVTTALSEGFGDATRTSLFVAAGFLALGLASSVALSARTRRR
ncbi:DHA2 family efflux MFS transporter permease subunit [Rhodococcus sp. NPDC059234]|uniref:DHA2 family efflux MFS transporter permease subunit n=1 Tax=Rhodococcus sp. NPDC059234 TaxID=3346781 RepID=UPI00366B33B7